MAIPRQDVIDRLKAGETIIHVLPKGGTEPDKPIQYLSGGGQGNQSHLQAFETPPYARQRRSVPGCRTPGMEVV
jgi:hypothetical protein